MKTILIAGAGQLGSRHLQGAKMSRNELDIWVYDLSLESLKVAEERYNQISSDIFKKVHFVTSLDEVPQTIDVAIVASSSKPRYIIVTQILLSHEVKYLVLEKFLFPRLSDYAEIEKLLKEKKVMTWVNCPRRMLDGYVYIKSLIDTSKPIDFSYEGGEWGMCCNTIHFADIFMFLNGEDTFVCNIDQLEHEVVDSKRAGYVELHGTEIFTTPKGSTLRLSSMPDKECDALAVIKNGKLTVEYYEGKGEVYVNGEKKEFSVQYQSSLTGLMLDYLFASGNCNLSTYAKSSAYHIEYLSKIAPFINKIKGWTTDSCPIT
ncbi:Gfo/Idh/MocA family oxidoreductase [Bacteroides cellulosilyticus]|jgi:predicted dehydrogenase|uniref:Gfo/Idh/MocA family oxidoreductase n=1 Tax=Bacteroides cellulosilyticus TaxID=246787 RepID=UPI00189EFE26|nr:Gfo/Idh/MocA family oxidoreductase [Bacteroides cellulosilyticus]